MKIALLLLSLLAVAAARKHARIHHGRVVSQWEVNAKFPFVVSLMVCGQACSLCAGSLVTRDTILTAAHCVCAANRIVAFFKSNKMMTGTQIPAQVKWINGNYRCGSDITQYHNDIATLRLSRPITDIAPIRLDCRDERMGEDIIILGFGLDERKKYGTLKIGYQNVGSCQTTQYPIICSDVYNGRRDRIDHGDSGGPMLVRSGSGFKQLGVQIGEEAAWGPRTVQIYAKFKPFCQRILQ